MTARRLYAGAALLCAAAAVGLAIAVAIAHFPKGLSVLACLVAAVSLTAYGVERRGLAQRLAIAVAGLLVAGAIVLVIVEHRVAQDLIIFGLVIAAVVCARQAFAMRVALPAAPRPRRPVLFYNPLSGGGKAQRWHLAQEARRRGIEPIELRRGDDLEQLVRGAVARGADGLAMAGGDGSQAVVAMVAAERGLPYACIPAGTRNHFALDLGVDRRDVVGALDAFVNGGERRVDLAEVNGRVFVNNVSLGLYADAVARPGYREAKLHTLLDTVPDVVGPNAKPLGLSWSGPGAEDSVVAVLISNDPYRLGRVVGSGTRPRLDRGVLGIAVLSAAETARAARHLAFKQWTATTFEILAPDSVAAGIDGESARLSPPLRFRTRPQALRVRIAPHHPGASPSALEPEHPWQMVGALVRLALRGEATDRDSGR